MTVPSYPAKTLLLTFKDQLVLSELHLFGSSRLGMINPSAVKNRMLEASVSETPVTVYSDESNTIVEYLLTGIDYGELSGLVKENTGLFRITAGKKVYELTNHLGNVNVIISDQKIAIEGASGGVDYYAAEILSITDYYAFGSPMYGRDQQISEYRYGFQNQETDQELWNGAVAYKYRVEDPRLGRFFSVDPLSAKYPWNSNYAFSENRLIDAIELEGLESVKLSDGSKIDTGPMTLEKQMEFYERTDQANQGITVTEWADGTPNLRTIEIIEAKAQPILNEDITTEYDSHSIEFIFDQGPKFTANFSANAGVKFDTGLVGGTFNYAGTTLIGLEDNDLYVMGHNQNNDIGREINKEYSFNVKLSELSPQKAGNMTDFFMSALTTGGSYKEKRIGSRSSEPIQTICTTQMLFFVYTEQVIDHRTNKTTSTTGLSWDVGIGLGIFANFGFKWPIIKE